MPFPIVTDEELAELRAKDPTAFRLSYCHPDSGESFGDLVFRKPLREEVRRFKDAAKAGKDTIFIVRACLLAPSLSDWDAITAQELSGLPETAENDLLKASGVLAEQSLGKR